LLERISNWLARRGHADTPVTPRAQPDTTEALLLPNEQHVFVRGVGYRQDALASIGSTSFNALLLPEPTNKFDENAVMVCSGIPNAHVQLGYLPADFEITALIGELAELVRTRDGYALACECTVEQKSDRTWIATVFLPHDDTVLEMLG
jgi:hypothetical protein